MAQRRHHDWEIERRCTHTSQVWYRCRRCGHRAAVDEFAIPVRIARALGEPVEDEATLQHHEALQGGCAPTEWLHRTILAATTLDCPSALGR